MLPSYIGSDKAIADLPIFGREVRRPLSVLPPLMHVVSVDQRRRGYFLVLAKCLSEHALLAPQQGLGRRRLDARQVLWPVSDVMNPGIHWYPAPFGTTPVSQCECSALASRRSCTPQDNCAHCRQRCSSVSRGLVVAGLFLTHALMVRANAKHVAGT